MIKMIKRPVKFSGHLTDKEVMNKKIDGKAMALEMLQNMTQSEQEKILGHMKKADPEMSAFLSEHLIDFSSLTKLTPKMLVDFLKHIPLETLGLALRGRPPGEADFFLQSVSSLMRSEINHTLKGPLVSVRKVQEAEQDILNRARELAKKGVIVLRTNDKEKIV
jgi:flagellar motor switch protein FliG